MGFFGFVFWMVLLWLAFRFWRRWESREMRRNGYLPSSGWYDSSEFYSPKQRKVSRQVDQNIEAQQGYVDSLERRVSELEERLDFTERLLAERRDSVGQS